MQERNKGSEAWPLLVARWGALEGHSRGILDQVAKGLAYLKHERKAAEQVITLAGSVPAEKVVRTALAMFIMLEERPTRFLSDQAFRFQLVRRVRGLSAVNAGEYHDYRTGKSRKVYRDMPPEAVKVLGQWVAEAFGASGSKLASMEQEKARQSAAEKQRLADALEGLQ
jgi:hypothetical protein